MLKKVTLFWTVIALITMTALSTATAQKLDLNKKLPIDPDVVTGQLDNGLTYYIRSNKKPENKIELRLVVDAGSILENDNQQGLAHFIEHMNFNGLKHFPKNELVHYLQSIGVQFGADLNANTGWDRTLYILPIPTDNPENIQNGFQIVADWASGALLSTDEINAERDVISEELRMRMKNAQTRMRKKYLPALLNNSRYAYRLPGGKDSIIQNADPDVLRQFYKDWYRPDLQAVVVVGDISVDKAKKLIKKYFGGIQGPKKERERTYYTIKPYTSPNAIVVSDHEATSYQFLLLFPAQKREIVKTIGDYRQSLVETIFTKTLNKKLKEMTQEATPPFTGAYGSVSGVFEGITLHNKGFMLAVNPVKNFEVAIDSAVAEVLRIKKYGFSKSDVQVIKNNILANYEQADNERNKTKSSSYVREYVGNFMRDEPIPGISNEYKYVKAILPTITAEEVSKLAEKVLSNSKNFFALITGPSDGNIDLPSNKELLSIVKEAFQQEVTASKEKTEKAESLLTATLKPGKIVSTKTNDKLGTTTYTLSNGVKVTVKPTDFKENKVSFKGVKFGGLGLFGEEDVHDASQATAIVSAMGYGQFSPSDLSDFLSGKNVKLSTSMGQTSDVVKGSSSVEDFKTLLKLNYLKLNSPRKDTGLFQGYVTKMKTRLKFLKANPQMAFIDTLPKVMYGNNPLAPVRIPSTEVLNNLNVDNIISIYKKQFGNADGFHFFIVGNTDKIENLKSLIEKYIASLPAKGNKAVFKDNGVRMVQGTKTFKFRKGQDQKSLMLNMYHGDNVKYSDLLALKVNLLGQVMTMEVLDTIREGMGAIYSGGYRANITKEPYPHYVIMGIMPCGPENVDTIRTVLAKQVEGFKTNGGPEGYLQKAKQQTIEKHKENMNKNSYWISQLEDVMVWGHSQKFFLNYIKNIQSITTQDIIEAANKLLGENHFTAILLPEKGSDDSGK